MLVNHTIRQRPDQGTHLSPKPDSLARVIVADLLRTTAGFLLVVTVIVLAGGPSLTRWDEAAALVGVRCAAQFMMA